jgi:hypothetical protein
MDNIKFSLCIPTMDRFDDFLDNYLEIYLQFKDARIVDEIIVCDENGNDYKKILAKYNQGNPDGPIRLYKNDTRLGVLKNKSRVVSLANPANFIALIDSDNFVGESYFKSAKRFIQEKKITLDMPCTMIPIYASPHYYFSYYKNFVFDGQTAAHYCKLTTFRTMINSGNFVISPAVYKSLLFDQEAEMIRSYDSVYLHLLAFQQIPEYRIYVLNEMEYLHVVHEKSNFLLNKEENGTFYDHVIVPRFRQFIQST